ncbi:hypothetical protein ACFL02_03995 [Planctomycetota bacterium]
MRIFGKILGYIILYGAGLIMFVFWFGAMSDWLGCFGGVLAIILCPGVIIFPLVYWIVEGAFPVFYFVMWGIGLIGLGICVISGRNED